MKVSQTPKNSGINMKTRNSNDTKRQQQKHYKKHNSKVTVTTLDKHLAQGTTQENEIGSLSEKNTDNSLKKATETMSTIDTDQATLIEKSVPPNTFSEPGPVELIEHEFLTSHSTPPECNQNSECLLEDRTATKQLLHLQEEHSEVQLFLHTGASKIVKPIHCNFLEGFFLVFIDLIKKQHILDHSEFNRSVTSIIEHTMQSLSALADEIRAVCIKEASKTLQFLGILEKELKESITSIATKCSESLSKTARNFTQRVFELFKDPKDFKERKKFTSLILRKLIPPFLDLIFNSYLGVLREPLTTPYVPNVVISLSPQERIDECFQMTDPLSITQFYSNHSTLPQSEVIPQSSPLNKSPGIPSSHSSSLRLNSISSQDSSFNTILFSYD